MPGAVLVRPATVHDAAAAVRVLIDSITIVCAVDHQNDAATLQHWLRNKTVRYFEHWLLRLQGVYEPDVKLSDEAQAFLAAARTCSPLGLAAIGVSKRALRELEASHRAEIAMHLEKDLKSVRVLRQMR